MSSGVRCDSLTRSRRPLVIVYDKLRFSGGGSFESRPVCSCFDARNREIASCDLSSSLEIKTLPTFISRFLALVNAYFYFDFLS